MVWHLLDQRGPLRALKRASPCVPSSYLWINVWLDTCALTEHLPQPRIDDKCCAVRLVRRSARLLLPDLGWEAPKIKVVVDPVQEILPRPRR